MLAVSVIRTIAVILTVDNPLIWRHLRGRHPLADLEGPEYLLGAPFRGLYLASPDERAQGRGLLLVGRVVDRETGEPVAGAVVEAWQANPATGRYAWLSYSLRGKFHADADGRYAIETVAPPLYRLPSILKILDLLALGLPHRLIERLIGVDLRMVRPPHIHLRVDAPGHRPLTTQVYFDPAHLWIDHDVTNLAHPPREALLVELQAGGPDTEFLARFDVLLDRRA